MGVQDSAQAARSASISLAALDVNRKNKALQAIINALHRRSDEIIQANERDFQAAMESNLAKPLLKRLVFDENKLAEVISGLQSLIKLDDPVGRTLLCTELDEDLRLYKVSCAIGVIGVVFESRPDALVQISTLCLKSGNAVLLKGGSEARHSNRILAEVICEGAREAGIPEG